MGKTATVALNDVALQALSKAVGDIESVLSEHNIIVFGGSVLYLATDDGDAAGLGFEYQDGEFVLIIEVDGN